MKDKPDYELFIEIAMLIKKHSPELAKNFAEYLSSPEFLERLVSVLSPDEKITRTTLTQEIKSTAGNKRLDKSRPSLTKETRTAQKKGNQSVAGNQHPKSSLPLLLIDLEKTEPEKSALLIKFYDSLMDKDLLPNLADIRTFASDKGLPPIKVTSRSKAILPLVKALLQFSVDELKKMLNAAMPMPKKDDRSLEGWANIILDKEQRTKLGD